METLWSLFLIPTRRTLCWLGAAPVSYYYYYYLRGSLAAAASSVEWAQNMCMGSLEKFTSKESVTFIHKSFIPIVHLSHTASQC